MIIIYFFIAVICLFLTALWSSYYEEI